MYSTRILAIRHGETAWNQNGRIQGHLNVPLNDTGVWQARQTARALAHETVAAIYASDLSRAHHTALAIGTELGLPVHSECGLRERCFGDFQGRTWQDLDCEQHELTDAWRRRVPDFAPPGGESLLTLRARIETTVNTLAARHLGQQMVLVAHGGVMDILYRMATRLDLQAPRSWTLGNASINRLLWTPDGMHLVGWGDSRHLEQTAMDEHTA